MRTYSEIADKTVVQMSDYERGWLTDHLDRPSFDFMTLTVALDDKGADAPKQQAALMLLNSPGVAMQLIQQYRKPPGESP